MKDPYPNEKFSAAIATMVTSPKSIQKRICDAYLYSLIHINLKKLPEQIQTQFDDFQKKMTCIEPTGNEGKVVATTNQMSTEEAIEIAHEILDMAYTVKCDYYDVK